MSQYRAVRSSCSSSVISNQYKTLRPLPYTEPPRGRAGPRKPRYRAPRHRTPDGKLTKTGQAGALAQLVRERFYLRRGIKYVPFRPLMIQAFRLFKRGYSYDDVCRAVEKAAAMPWWRARQPRTLWEFIPQLKRVRAERENVECRACEREQDREALARIEVFCGISLMERLRVAPAG